MAPAPVAVNSTVQEIETHLLVLAGETFCYGAYAVMFGFYIYVIRTRGMFNNCFLTITTITLFILCTAHFALLWADMIFYDAIWETVLNSGTNFRAPQPSASIYSSLNRAANTVYITSNVIADSIFIFRCYAIWNFRRTVIILPTILTVLVAGLGYMNVAVSLSTSGLSPEVSASPTTFSALLFDISMAISVLTTFILMALSAGRIWWLAHTSQKIMGQRITSRYYTFGAMLLESGALYCVGAIAFICVALAANFRLVKTDATTSGAIVGQLVGIAPTIIAVRVGLGRSVENVDSFITASQVQPHKRTPRMLLEFRSAGIPVHTIEPQVLDLCPDSGAACEKEVV